VPVLLFNDLAAKDRKKLYDECISIAEPKASAVFARTFPLGALVSRLFPRGERDSEYTPLTPNAVKGSFLVYKAAVDFDACAILWCRRCSNETDSDKADSGSKRAESLRLTFFPRPLSLGLASLLGKLRASDRVRIDYCKERRTILRIKLEAAPDGKEFSSVHAHA